MSLHDDGHHPGIHLLRNAVRLRARVKRPRRFRLAVLLTLAGLFVLAGIVGGAVVLQSPSNPMSFSGLNHRVAEALRGQIGQDWTVSVDAASLSWRGVGPGLDVAGVTIRNPAGDVVLRAPRGAVEVDGLNLAVGQFRPTSISLSGLDLKLFVDDHGGLRVDTGAGAFGIESLDAGTSSATSLFMVLSETENLFGSLARAELRDARLIIVERDGGERTAFQNVRVAIERGDDARRHIEIEVEGSAGPWSVSADLAGHPGTERTVMLGFKDVALADLWLLGGQTVFPVDPRSALSGSALALFDAAGNFVSLRAEAGASGGRIGLKVGEVDHLPLDRLTLALRQAEAGLDIEDMRFTGGGSDLGLKGTIRPAAGEGWRVALTADGAVLSGAGPNDPPVKLDRAALDALVSTSAVPSVIDIRVNTAGADAAGRMTIAMQPDGPQVTFEVSATPVDVRTALRLWPAFAATGTRQYLVDTLPKGVMEQSFVRIDLPPHIVKTFFNEQPWPDQSVQARFALRDAEFRPAPGLPPLTRARLDGTVTATTASLRMPEAVALLPGGRQLTVSDGSLVSANTTGKRPLAQVGMRLTGQADAFFALIGSEALRPVTASDIDPATASGEVDLRANLEVRLGAALDAREVASTVKGTLTNLSLENAFGTEKLENGNFTFNFTDNNLQMRGDARLLGLPATIEVKPGIPGTPSLALVSMTLDDAARRRRGINLGRKLAGPILLKATAQLGQPGAKARVEADLSRTAIEELVPGWSKPAGKPAKLAFTLGNKPGAVILEDIQLESPTLDARGQAELKPDLTPVSAEFDDVRLSQGDNLTVKVSRAGPVTKIAVNGAVLDARPFIKSFQAPPPSPGRGRAEEPEGADIDLEVAVPVVTGFNEEAITQASLTLSQRGRDLRELRFTGRIGASPVRLELLRDNARSGWFLLQSQDAGALLRYVDLYRRMVGGDLTLRMTAFEPIQNGDITIREFALRNEPALGQIMSEQLANTTNDERAAIISGRRASANVVAFTKARGDFSRSASRLEIRDAVMWGALVGLNIGGTIDYGRDRVDLDGTYVPAYGLNNAFAQVPLFGPLLGGGATEGLFAVSFRIGGAASAPTLTVNPLSFVAPGIFRKFVDAFRLDQQTTGSTPVR